MKRLNRVLVLCVLFVVCSVCEAGPQVLVDGITVGSAYPNLAYGVLTFAKLGELPEGVLLKAGSVKMTIEDVQRSIGAQPAQFHEELNKNAFFVLEQESGGKLLLSEAKKGIKSGNGKADSAVINDYIAGLTQNVTVSDEDIQRFYKENETMFCYTPFEKVKEQIRQYVLAEKKQQVVTEHIKTIGQRMDIVVCPGWVKEQAVQAKDNALGRAVGNGKVTLAVFGAASCCGPDKMVPVLDSLNKKYAQKLNVIYLDARKEQILAARYAVHSVPTQVFWDKSGSEFFRHSGFFSEKEIADKLTAVGIQ
ncbi:MAG TPA: thioredoxin domain-containing protein [Sedimentisphaerales bacterium]|nr:thioredoxin domain-containing protein [Sedimentisphaerales bacterium]